MYIYAANIRPGEHSQGGRHTRRTRTRSGEHGIRLTSTYTHAERMRNDTDTYLYAKGVRRQECISPGESLGEKESGRANRPYTRTPATQL
jgi:hypothetical protein